MPTPRLPWPDVPATTETFKHPPREFGILPFWFLNGDLDPDEMRWQLREFREKGMPGIILHGRFGLELPYLGPNYLDRIALAVAEGEKLGLTTWIYDEMNWPSGTADYRVVRERPDLVQRYLECISFPIRGPWFAYLTGVDSRYLDFERSLPVAAFGLGDDGRVVDLTPYLSFENVVPWQVPPGNWRIMYLVEKRAEYYIDALDPEATREFLRLGYEPYLRVVGDKVPAPMVGFYTDEPAMHYYVTGADNPIVPWTREMFGRFRERNGYELRPRLPDLFFDVSADSARVRHDFYETLTAFYADAYYRQIHDWCRERGLLFTGHLLYEEWLRQMVRVEGNPFKHYPHLDVVGVDHLYPIVGSRDRPAEHVAIKLAASAAHQGGGGRLLCESFGGIFMDATMQRMKWLTDWEYVLGVSLLNPHGFHYTLEGPRKRDWPPSMFYQYPWWHFYGHFSAYVARLSHLLSGGHHVAKVAVLWPATTVFANYTPQRRDPLANRTEFDFNTLTDLLLRLHHDFDYLDEDVLATADVDGGTIRLGGEAHELLILPPLTHLKVATVDLLERFVRGGGRLLGTVFLPDGALGPDGLVDIAARVEAIFGVDPRATQRAYRAASGIETSVRDHPTGGKAAFLRSHALNRQLPARLRGSDEPEAGPFLIEEGADGAPTYWFAPPDDKRQEITAEVTAERATVAAALAEAIAGLIEPDVVIDNPEVFCLHRVKDGRDLYFLVNPTFAPQPASVRLAGEIRPLLWDPSTGEERPIAPWQAVDGATRFRLDLPPVGSAFVVADSAPGPRVVESTVVVDAVATDRVLAHGEGGEQSVVVERAGRSERLTARAVDPPPPLLIDGDWEFVTEDANALVLGRWLATAEAPGTDPATYAALGADTDGWRPMVPGAWSYQLPTEPDVPYPIDVWYRIPFRAAYRPPALDLLVDGFAGSDWQLFVNGEPVTAEPRRSPIDAQMRAVDIAGLVREGDNVVALRLTVTQPTDGLLDLLKLLGAFALERQEDGTHRIAPPPLAGGPEPWTGQGYPFYSGRGLYRCTFDLPAAYDGFRLDLEPALNDDVLEVVVNGRVAGVRLWPPYGVDIADFVRPGQNLLELRVANTPVNLLEATERASGLTGPPRLVPSTRLAFDVPG